MPQHHVLRASPETCHWGFFDAALKPVLRVASGDTVTLDSVSGGPDILPTNSRFDILPEHKAIHAAIEPRMGAHILTGPIAVVGAEPGDERSEAVAERATEKPAQMGAEGALNTRLNHVHAPQQERYRPSKIDKGEGRVHPLLFVTGRPHAD